MSNPTTNKKIPTPEEIQKEFESFVKQKYGGTVRFIIPHAPASPATDDANESSSKRSFDLQFELKPKDIKQYLDRYVIKQDEAKKALAIAVCD
ncbi:hypothetical protein HYR99_21110, partial [Candidatus Poribacteria bacterium]|nr:hypothetical protein [Candidatus Poribacteria bacterium]